MQTLKQEKVENLRLKTALRGRHSDLKAQRDYKETLLKITQGKEALFNRFIAQKTQRENELSSRIEKLEGEYDGVFEEVSSRHGCSVTGSGVEAEVGSKPKCSELKRYYEAEKVLRDHPLPF